MLKLNIHQDDTLPLFLLAYLADFLYGKTFFFFFYIGFLTFRDGAVLLLGGAELGASYAGAVILRLGSTSSYSNSYRQIGHV